MNERYSRQGFLGEAGQVAIETARVCINGLGGGGSIIAPELAHLGVRDFVLFDPDHGDESNLNPTMTLTEADIPAGTLKVEAARRRILEINPWANLEIHACRWQDRPKALDGSTLVMGASIPSASVSRSRRAVAACWCPTSTSAWTSTRAPRLRCAARSSCRPRVARACSACTFLTEEKIGREVANYGAAGGRPQVVWSNGVLASTAVGIAVNVLAGWTKSASPIYLQYNGNDGTLTPHVRLRYIAPGPCPHYPQDQAGELVFVKV